AFSISRWIESFSPLVAFLNSDKPFPRERPNSGRRFGPNTNRATTKMTIISGKPMDPMEVPLSDRKYDNGGKRQDQVGPDGKMAYRKENREIYPAKPWSRGNLLHPRLHLAW